MRLRVLKLLTMFFLVIFLAAFSIIRNGERTIDFDSINYLDSKFKFISVESVDKLLKQSDSISLKLMKRNLNLGSLERIINKNAFIYSAEVSLSLDRCSCPPSCYPTQVSAAPVCRQGCSKRKLTFKLGGSKLTFGSSLVQGRKRVCMRLLRAPWGHIPYNVN